MKNEIYKFDGEILVRYEDQEPVIENMLAVLLINEVVFINDHWWEKDWSEDAKKSPSINVVCNDTFGWACADAEEIIHSEIPELYEMWEKDSDFGPLVWCCKKRQQKPIKPIYDQIQKNGIWNLDEIIQE